jgi:hypothetical protein
MTTDPNDPNLHHSFDEKPTEQAKTYLVLSEEERAKGFVRPVRDSYVHLRMADGSELPKVLQSHHKTVGCGALTKMGRALAETYARDPKFYSGTYCVGCKMHRPVEEFTWDKDGSVVGS